MKESFSEFLKQEYIEHKNEQENYVLNIPYISLQWLFGINGIPLTRIIMVAGDPASFKSTFLFFLGRIFHYYKGNTVIVDTEANTFPCREEMLYKINDERESVFNITKPSMEDWQSFISEVLVEYKKSKKEDNSPLMLAVDSVIGGLDEKTYKKAEKVGFVNPGFSPQPRILSDVSKKLCRDLYETKNVSVFLTNHEKKFSDPITGATIIEYPGGFRLKFMCSVILSFSRLKGPIKFKNRTEYLVKITTRKNRFGPEKNTIVVPWVIFNDKKIAFFDFIRADLDLLTNQTGMNKADKEIVENNIKEVVNIKAISGGSKGKLYYCKEIGLDKDSATNGRMLMKELYKSEGVYDELLKILNIKKFPNHYKYDIKEFLNQEEFDNTSSRKDEDVEEDVEEEEGRDE